MAQLSLNIFEMFHKPNCDALSKALNIWKPDMQRRDSTVEEFEKWVTKSGSEVNEFVNIVRDACSSAR